MTSRLYLRKPVLHGGTDVDLTAYMTRKGAPFFDGQRSLIEMGHRYYEGEASQGEFIVEDPYADIGTAFPLGHSLVTWTEDATGTELWLARGRVGNDEGSRGIAIIDDEVEWAITVDDGNVDLRGQAFAESWVRPEETDIQRLVALQLYTLNGSSSTATHHRDTCEIIVNTSHLAPNANTVTMPPKKYPPGTQPGEVVKDCADTAGKMYGVVIHHTGGSHLCLLYIVNSDHTTYLSPGSISDNLTDWDPDDATAPVWEPHWERGPGTIFAMQTLLSGLVGTYGPESGVFVEYAGVADNYDYWVDVYHDSTSTTEAQAADRTAGILEGRRMTHVTNRVSLIIRADQMDMIGAGMSIPIKSAVATPGYIDTYRTLRIGECRFEPILDGRYWAHLDLERPPLRVAPGRGSVGPLPPVQSEPPISAITDFLWDIFPSPTGVDDTTGTITTGPGISGDGSVYSGSLDPSCGSDDFPLTAGDYHFRAVYRSTDVNEIKGVELINVTLGGAVVDQTALTGGAVLEDGFDFTVSGSHSFVWRTYGPSSGHRAAVFLAEVSHGSTSPSFAGTANPLPSEDGEGAVGISPIYSPIDHQHPAQVAVVTSVIDEGGFFEGATVEGVLQELATAHAVLPATLVSFGVVGPILISDDHSTPIVFADILLTEDGSDILYSDIGG